MGLGVSLGVRAIRETALKGVIFPLPNGFALFLIDFFITLFSTPSVEPDEPAPLRAAEFDSVECLSSLESSSSADLFAGQDEGVRGGYGTGG